MKLKDSTIKDFAKALGMTDNIEKEILTICPNNHLKLLFQPILIIPEVLKHLLISVLFFLLFPYLVIRSLYVERHRIGVLYYYFKHRKEIKAYKQYLKSKETKCAK